MEPTPTPTPTPTSSSSAATTNTSATTSNSTTPSVFHLRIKSFKDVEIAVPAGSVVAHVKQQVRAALGKDDTDDSNNSNSNSNNDFLRLICKGRLLLPDDHPISDFNVQNGDVVHAVLAPKPSSSRSRSRSRSRSTTTPRNSSSTTRMGTRTNSGATNSTRQRRRPPRSNGIVVGPGGRVTRAPPRDGGGDWDEDSSSSSDSSISEDENENENVQHTHHHRQASPTIVEGMGGDSNTEADIEAPAATTRPPAREQNRRRRRRQSHRRRGFDRLREAPNAFLPTRLPRSEVQAIRAYFSRQVDRYQASNIVQQDPQRSHANEPDVLLRRRLLEEDWMAQQGPASEFRLNLNQNTLLRLAALQQNGTLFNGRNTTTIGGAAGAAAAAAGGAAQQTYGSLTVGTDRDFVWGLMLGFFVGFVMLVWVWMPTVPHKQKIGILTGISFQLAITVFVEPPPTTEQDAGNSGSGDYYYGDDY
jgi:hypothetical protein